MTCPLQAPSQPPQAFRVIGRHPQLENADICGEYCYISNHGGYPAYRNHMTGMAIRFYNGRWLMDRGGLRDNGVCVAFAQHIENSTHPAHTELVWSVWDSNAALHVEDPDVFAIDAPETVTFVGRARERENAGVCGKYIMDGVINNMACYRHQTDDLFISYCPTHRRWMISAERDVGTVSCSAWADAVGNARPGDATLKWQFFEKSRKTFVYDPSAGFVDAPDCVNVFGRHPQAENSRINGTYHLVGIHADRPLYQHPGNLAVMRYSPKKDWWLIDCEGLAKPSLLARFQQYIMTGDQNDAYDACSAWASARNTEHPGYLNLEWNVWESTDGRHVPDKAVRCTSSPAILLVSGRNVFFENTDVNGEYHLAGTFQGRSAYRKPGTQFSLYFSRQGRWVFDRNGTRDTGVCAAYAEGDCFDHPTQLQKWHFYESARGSFMLDPDVSIEVLQMDLPAVPTGNQLGTAIGLPSLTPTGCGIKRARGLESNFAPFAHPHDQHPQKVSRTAYQGRSGWPGIFGA